MQLDSKKILVYGVGRSGRAAGRLLVSQGASPVFYDDEAAKLPEGPWGAAEFHSGKLPDSGLSGVELAVVSPGVHPDSPVFEQVRAAGIPIVSEIELAARCTNRPLVGVTGTNGKSTTVALIDSVLRAAGYESRQVGNNGYPFSLAVLEHPGVDFYVVEVSSYQLATVDRFHVRAGVVTNLAANHHQWHGSTEAYYAAKLRLFERMSSEDVAVFPAGEEYFASHLSSCPARKIAFTWGGVPGDVHWDAKSSRIVWRESGEVLLDLGALARRLPFDFHAILWNLLAAVAVGHGLALPARAFEQATATFSPLAHRMEPVREMSGIRWVNDSKSTNVESTRYAIENSPARLVLMLGGRDKGLDFSGLTRGQEGHIKAVVALGECREKIREQLGERLPVHVAATFEEAVNLAGRLATNGDTVLFSPACASFDMFRDFEHRGEVFKTMVNGLPASRPDEAAAAR